MNFRVQHPLLPRTWTGIVIHSATVNHRVHRCAAPAPPTVNVLVNGYGVGSQIPSGSLTNTPLHEQNRLNNARKRPVCLPPSSTTQASGALSASAHCLRAHSIQELAFLSAVFHSCHVPSALIRSREPPQCTNTTYRLFTMAPHPQSSTPESVDLESCRAGPGACSPPGAPPDRRPRPRRPR